MTKPVTAAAYARIRGVSKTAVAKAIKSGRISTIAGPGGTRLVDVDRANVEWAANTNIERQRQGAPGQFERTQPLARESAARLEGDGRAPAAAGAAERGSARGPAPAPGAATLLEEKTRSERLRVERQEIELATMRGEFLSRAAVHQALVSRLIAARETFETIPDRISAAIAVESDVTKVHRLLRDAIRTALAELASVETALPH